MGKVAVYPHQAHFTSAETQASYHLLSQGFPYRFSKIYGVTAKSPCGPISSLGSCTFWPKQAHPYFVVVCTLFEDVVAHASLYNKA